MGKAKEWCRVDCAGIDGKGIKMRLAEMILSLSVALFDCFEIFQIKNLPVVFWESDI